MDEILRFHRNLQACPDEERLERLLAFYAADVFAGVRPASLVSLLRVNGTLEQWRRRVQSRDGRFGSLSIYELRATDASVTLLIYDRAKLSLWLRQAGIHELLREHGYRPGAPLVRQLRRLRSRCAPGCPHEIGLFLGYPGEDVRGFIRHGGQCYKCCGYWKVYDDPERSREIFCRIAALRRRAASLLNGPLPLKQAVELIERGA